MQSLYIIKLSNITSRSLSKREHKFNTINLTCCQENWIEMDYNFIF